VYLCRRLDWTSLRVKDQRRSGFQRNAVECSDPYSHASPISAPVAPPVNENSPPVVALPVNSAVSSSANNSHGRGVLIFLVIALVASICWFAFAFSRRRQTRNTEVEHVVENANNSYPTFQETYPSAGLSNRQPFRDPESDAMSVNLGLDEDSYKDQLQVNMRDPIDDDRHALHNVEIL
jgi:hypothetical protein